MIFFTSDPHFGHENVIGFCNRPFKDVKEMEACIVKRWQERVKATDTVYVLGDWALCKFRAYADRNYFLPGKKILVQGNHDKWSQTQYESLGFLVLREARIHLRGQFCTLSHYPWAPTDEEIKSGKIFPLELRFLDRRPARGGGWLLHGHTHDKCKRKGLSIHVGVDAWNFYPVSEHEIEHLMNKKEDVLP